MNVLCPIQCIEVSGSSKEARQALIRVQQQCAAKILLRSGCSDGELAPRLANVIEDCVLCFNIVSLYVPIALPPSVVPRSAQDISGSHSATEPQLPLSAQDT